MKKVPLVDPELMKHRLRTFAMLDAIVAPEFRSFEFHPRWARGQQLGAFKDGSGNFFFAWFCRAGAVLRGFDHERQLTAAQRAALIAPCPPALGAAHREPAFALDELTFCLWNVGRGWKSSNTKSTGEREVLGCFRPNFAKWAAGYYGERLDPRALNLLWWGREPIELASIRALNPEPDLPQVRAEAKLLGYRLVR